MNNKIEFLVEKTIKLLVPVIFFLPFVTQSTFYFPYITPRNFAFRILVSILFGLFLVLVIKNKNRFKPVLNKFLIAYFALILILSLSSLINGDFLYSFWSNNERMEGLINYYYLSAFLLVILGTYRSKKAWLYLLSVTAFASFVMSFIGLSQHLGANFLQASSGGSRVSATLGNPTYLATYALFHIFFAAYLFFKENRKKLRFELFGFYILDLVAIVMEIVNRHDGAPGLLTDIFSNFLLATFFIIPQIFVHVNFFFPKHRERLRQLSTKLYFVSLILINFVSLFNTQTRGALLGLVLALLLGMIFVSLSKTVKKNFRILAASVLLIIVIFSGLVYAFGDSTFVQNNTTLRRMASISVNDVTTEARLLTWKAGLKGFLEKPILGWGEERFYVVFNKYFPPQIFKDNSSRVWFDRPHNIFIQQLVNGGSIGFIFFAGIYVLLLVALYRHYRKTKDTVTIVIFGGLIIGYLAQNFFVFDSFNSSMPLMLTFACVAMITSRPRSKSENKKTGNAWVALVAFLVVLSLGYFSNIPQAMANHNFVVTYRDFKTRLSAGYDAQLNERLKQIMDSHYFGSFELRQVYTELAQDVANNPLVSPTDALSMVKDAENEMLRSIDQQPDNVRHNIFLVNLYTDAASLDPAYFQKNIDLINKSIPLSPTRSQLYYSLGRAYMGLQYPENAINAFKKGVELNPQVLDSYTNLLAVYLTIDDENGQQDIAEQIRKDLTPSAYIYGRTAEIYDAFGKDEEAMQWLADGVAKYPDSVQLVSQAIVFSVRYTNAADTEKYLQLLANIDPNIAVQARTSIQQQFPDLLK